MHADGPETRFGAAVLFNNYFLAIGADDSDNEDERFAAESQEHEAIVWDMAVACLALSIKVRPRLKYIVYI
jgi:hypothetical protein